MTEPNRIGGRTTRMLALMLSRSASLAVVAFIPCAGPIASFAAAQTAAEALPIPGMSEYRRKLQAYDAARRAFDEQASAYWTTISDKRRTRFAKRRNKAAVTLEDYVLTQPPVYSGPPRPKDPSGEPSGDRPRARIPVIADFLQAAQTHFGFVPDRARNELEFKLAYARTAAAAGLSRDQVVRIFAFEAGGNGTHTVQAGLESQKPGARAISTALGYNQLLTTNTVSILAEKGEHLVNQLKQKAARVPAEAGKKLEHKITVLRRMIAVARSVPIAWSEHEKLGAAPQGLGIHALVLDIDIGPLLQTQKLMDSVIFARTKGIDRALNAAELEMMNLTGDGNGFDMVSMPPSMREVVPTSNFFQRRGYERNPVAIRNNTIAKLIAATSARMDQEAGKPGAKELAAAFSNVSITRSE